MAVCMQTAKCAHDQAPEQDYEEEPTARQGHPRRKDHRMNLPDRPNPGGRCGNVPPPLGDSRSSTVTDLEWMSVRLVLLAAVVGLTASLAASANWVAGANAADLGAAAGPAAAVSLGPLWRVPPFPPRRVAAPRSFPSLSRRAPWSLPPIVTLRANSRSDAGYRWLRRRVLTSGRLALSPKARRAIVRRQVSGGALALLLTKPRTGSPLLVFSARDSRLRVQETTLAGTRVLLDRLSRLRNAAAPLRIVLLPMEADQIYLKDTGWAGTGTNGRGDIAVRAALRWVGVPYSWGGGDAFGPTRGFCGPAGCQGLSTIGFDCSGLTLHAWAQAGVLLPHYTGSQFKSGLRIARVEDLLPGDLLFFHDDLGHVGMYLGNGQMIHAPQTGDVVRIADLAGSRYERSFRGAVRPDA